MKAYELLADPEAWTQGQYARGENGEAIDPHFKGACSRCVLGAIAHCYGEDYDGGTFRKDIAHKLRTGLQDRGMTRLVSIWNDQIATHSEIVSILKELDI